MTNEPINGHDVAPALLRVASDEVLGPAFGVWRILQDKGQQKLVRFGRFLEEHGTRMRHQTGHEHRCSVCFLFTQAMIMMRPFVKLDELLLTRCINHHDEPEGILKVDVPATTKQASDDLTEYLTFEQLYKPLGPAVWAELQKAFLLQFCIDNPPCFPEDARGVMIWLSENRRNEALFFDGVQRYDYIFYAYECWAEHGIAQILDEVAINQIQKLDRIAEQLLGFSEVIWTPERRLFFQQTHMDLGMV